MKSPTTHRPRESGDFSEDQRAVLVALPGAALARIGGEPGLRERLARIAAQAHPHWLRWLGCDAVAGRLVREWVNGFTLRELRQRRELPRREVVELCARLPDALSAMENAGLPVPRPLLGEVFVAFGPETDPRGWLGSAVREWPAFTLKVNPLQMADGAGESGTGTATQALAELLCDLLGSHAASRALDRPPLAALGDSANAVLREALLGSGSGGAGEFWQRFTHAIEDRPAFQPRIVTTSPHATVTVKPLGRAAHATLLRLRPASKGALPVHVSARPCLRIGRSSRTNDILTRFLPETPANAKLTDRLGRVHVLGRRVNGWPCFWDGDGRCPSVNGAWLDEERLDGEAGTRSAQESCLRLGREYRLQVTCLDEESVALEIRGERPATGPANRGCTVIFSASGQPPTRLVAWLGGSVGLQIAGHGLAWNHAGAACSDAALLHADGGFWLANLALPHDSIRIDGAPVAPGCAAALREGQEIAMGAARYRVRTEE